MQKKLERDNNRAANAEVTSININLKEEKEVIWRPEKLRQEIKKCWPDLVRKDVGFQLGRVQQGLDPDHFREVPSIAVGVREIKLQDKNKSQYRLIYIAKFAEGIYVFHVITKKTTEKTSKEDLEIAKKRYKEIVEDRNKAKLV
jgi:phage-related protein